MGGGNCLQYLKRGGTEEGRGHKDFKKGFSSWVKGWICQHQSHPICYGICAASLSHQHQPTMINTIGSR